MEAFVLGIAINLASTLLVAGGRRLGEEALGDGQEQALQDAFARATAAMLVEIARYAGLDRNLPGRLEEQFSTFFEDRWVAETLVDSALRSRTLPVDELRRRYEALGFDPGTLSVSFDRAMNVFAVGVVFSGGTPGACADHPRGYARGLPPVCRGVLPAARAAHAHRRHAARPPNRHPDLELQGGAA